MLLAYGARPIIEYFIVLRTMMGMTFADANNSGIGAVLATFGVSPVVGTIILGLSGAGLTVAAWGISPKYRLHIFGAFIILMTYLSPLVWYRHATFLLVPIALSLDLSLPWAMIGLLFIQSNQYLVNLNAHALGLTQADIERGAIVPATGVAMLVGAAIVGEVLVLTAWREPTQEPR